MNYRAQLHSGVIIVQFVSSTRITCKVSILILIIELKETPFSRSNLIETRPNRDSFLIRPHRTDNVFLVIQSIDR